MKIKIVQDSTRLFHRYGVKTLSMNDIARLSGTPAKILTSYFPNKESSVYLNISSWLSLYLMQASRTDSLLELLLNYAEAYPKLYRKIDRRCCMDIKKYYPPAYALLTEAINRYAADCQNKVEEGIAGGHIRKKTPPGLVYVFMQEQFSKLLTLYPEEENENEDNSLMTEMIRTFTRGIVTLKGRAYIDKKIKSELK